ncbi:MAG: hypothetical protein JHD28_11640 [Bacteroidia bacterium]|nr:hypothetical protein [Bacteroidia bacterium]
MKKKAAFNPYMLPAGVLSTVSMQALSMLHLLYAVELLLCRLCIAYFLFFRREGNFLIQFYSGWKKAHLFANFGLRVDLSGLQMCVLLCVCLFR